MNNIYFFWWQGIENAPDIIKICYKSLLKYYDNSEQQIILIDSKNYNQYVKIPNYIIEKHKLGIISITHLSDLIRFMLLYENGGMWVDASILFTKHIDKQIFEKDFFIMKNPSAKKEDITSKWECFLIGGKKHYPLFKILVDFWLEYWKNENQLITYLLTEHIFYIIYRENEDIKRELDNADSFYYPIDYFQKKLNSPYSYNIFKEIFDKEKYLKLSYKYELYDKINDKKTFYGKLKELYNVKD